MIRHRAELATAKAADTTAQSDAPSAPANSDALPRTVVLYSARSADELVYRSELESLAALHPRSLDLYLSATDSSKGAHAAEGSWKRFGSSSSGSSSGDFPSLNSGRVPLGLLRSLVDSTHSSLGHIYVCGPPGMVDELLPLVHSITGVDSPCVHFERWW